MMYNLISVLQAISNSYHVLMYCAGEIVYNYSDEKKEGNKLLKAGEKYNSFLHNTENSPALGRSLDTI